MAISEVVFGRLLTTLWQAGEAGLRKAGADWKVRKKLESKRAWTNLFVWHSAHLGSLLREPAGARTDARRGVEGNPGSF
jgi:hypothetical protein